MDNPAPADAAGPCSRAGPAPALDLPSLSARVLTSGHCPPLVLSSVYNDSLSLKDSVGDQLLRAGRPGAGCGDFTRTDLSTMRARQAHASTESFTHAGLPAPCGSSASGGGRDVESAIRKYERILRAQVHGGLFDRDRAKQEPNPRRSQTAGEQPCHLSGLHGDYSVDVERHNNLQEVYSGLSSYLTAASLRHSLQLTTAMEIDRDAQRWRREKENLLCALQDAHIFDSAKTFVESAGDERMGTALLHQYRTLLASAPKAQTGLRQSPSLTRPEYQLIQFLLRHSRGTRSAAHRTNVERLPLHLLLQLSRLSPATSLATVNEGVDGGNAALEVEDQQLLQRLAESHRDSAGAACEPVGESWDVYTPQQEQQFASLARLLTGACRLLLLKERSQELGGVESVLSGHLGDGRASRQEVESRSSSAFILRGLVGNGIAALELEKRAQLQSAAEQTGAGTSWWRGQQWATSDRIICGQQAAEPWLRLAASEVQVERSERGSAFAEEFGTETDQGGGDAGDRSLWWRAVYYAFRTGDLKCLLTLGAGTFLQQAGAGGVCTMHEATAAITAAANSVSGFDDVTERSRETEDDGSHAASLNTSAAFPPPQPPLLPFISRQLLVLLLQTSVAANKRNAPDLTTNDEEEKSLSNFFSSLPAIAALQPRSMPTTMAHLLLLYPPPSSSVTAEGSQTTTSVSDPHLLLLLSLINPSVWLPISIAQTLPSATQEDFLHYKLHLAHATSALSLEPDKELCVSLKDLGAKLRQQGPAYFDSEDPSFLANSSLLQDEYFDYSSLMHINFGYPRVLALCGCFVEATIWLLDTFPLFRRPALLLFLLLRSCGALHDHQLNQLDSTSCSFRRNAGKGCDGEGSGRGDGGPTDEDGEEADEDDDRTASYMLLRVVKRGISGSSALTQIILLTILPSCLWSAIISRLISGQFALLSSSAVLGDMTSNGDEIAPGLLARVLAHQQQQHLMAGQEQGVPTTRPWLLEDHLNRLLSCLYAALRDEGRRRGSIREAFVAAWLLGDFRSCADIFTDALNESAFSVYDLPPEDELETRNATFFLSAYSLLERFTPSEDIVQALRGPWQQAKVLWLTRQGNYRGALQLFNQIQRSSRPLLWAPPLPPVAPVEQALLLRTLPPGAARLIDCIAFLLLKLLEQNSQLESLISYDQLSMLQQVATNLPASSSPRIKETRAMLAEFLRQYRDQAAYSRGIF